MSTSVRAPATAGVEQNPWYLRYGAAVLLVVAALSLTFLLSTFRPSAETPVFLLAIGVAAWFGGAGPAMIATFLSVIALDVYVFPVSVGWSFRSQDLIGLGSFVAASIVIASIAKRKSRLEHGLERSEQRYRAFVENSSEGIWCFEGAPPIPIDLPEDEQIDRFYRDAYLSECNDALAHMYGFTSADELRGARLENFLIRSDPKNIEYLRAFIRSGYRLIEAESRELDRSGNVHYFLNNLVAVIENGRLLRAWGTQRDITERKRTEEALQASEKLASIGRLAATIAHEINNPLDSAAGIVHLLENDSKTSDRNKELLGIARNELTRVAQISKNTLAFYREAPNPVPINLCEILDGVLGLYEQKVRFDDIRIVKQYDFRGEIPGFPGELRQVFSNLIRNALEAVKQGGTVTLRITQARDWREPHRKGVRVLIADDGTGVSREYRTKLFQPFFSTKGEKGSGLGLWITRGIVRKHGGKIRVHSITRQGRSGTCFSVFLPFQYAGVEAAQRSSA